MIKNNQKLKSFILILFFLVVTLIILFIAIPLHEVGHYIVADHLADDVFVVYDFSITSWTASCQADNVSETNNIIIGYSGGLFSGGILGLLWLLTFGIGHKDKDYHISLNFGLAVSSLTEIAKGIIEGTTIALEIYGFYRLLIYISLVGIIVLLTYRYEERIKKYLGIHATL